MNDYRVDKPDDPYHGKMGELIHYTSVLNQIQTGVVHFPDGTDRAYRWNELRAVIRIRV